ncbi:MAG: hypothetical protein A3D67_00200 [Candidatus Lloydbacteria bacterium RIFCSPHIGHO2_02_FULL_51_22]|uniref:TrbC/VIRB2 family protein n=2 Tax=Candidatus Lloydiibacteriota TaxID=1817910 RepID=A0A1G2DDN9_9BACT|nr:MAG: hypothetical protein A3D67_00200 [Candidatus Lloydbacteria bacterium RIFCSPHIGHO2_02_FULL_51_22]OGZ15709.1 MAG: hypothetical protein A3J08_02480 [Candidatus Lloydbacteria bacterium RIFCSPLOWO2_02_FULL_51_11]
MRKIKIIFVSITALFFVAARTVFANGGGGTPENTTFTLSSPLKDIGGIPALINALITNIVLPLGVSVATIAIIYAGFLYVKAAGNENEVKKVHGIIWWTLVGTAVLLGASVIARLIEGTINQLRS